MADAEQTAQAAADVAAAANGSPAGDGRRGDPEPRPHPSEKPRRSETANARQKRRKRAASSSSSPSRQQTTRARTRELELGLARTLSFPAVPVLMLPGDVETKAFLATHFTTAGPQLAGELAQASEQSAELREWLERMARGSLAMTLAIGAIGYLGPAVLWTIGRRGEAQAMSLALQMDEDALEQVVSAAVAGATIPPDASPAPAEQPSPGQGSPAAEAEPPAGS